MARFIGVNAIKGVYFMPLYQVKFRLGLRLGGAIIYHFRISQPRRDTLDQAKIEKIKSLPEYQQLVKERTSLAWTLSIAILVVYYGYIMLLAFNPEFFTTIVSGEYVSIGFPIGVAIIVFAFLLTGYYVKKANDDFDELTAKIKKEVE